MQQSTTILATYDYRLVALSVLIAICASYTALDLARHVTAARAGGRMAWLFGGAVAMGTGIWSMHYTGMLAYRLPIPVYYHVPTVALSLVAAIAASLIALYVISRDRVDILHVVGGSLLIATGIVAMHYTGMAAMRLQAMHEYDPALVALSVVIAVVVAFAAVGLTFQFRDGKQGTLPKLFCSIIMGLAIPGMHYSAMFAVSYMPTNTAPDLTLAMDISAVANAAIIILTFILFGSVFLLRFWVAPSSPEMAVSQS